MLKPYNHTSHITNYSGGDSWLQQNMQDCSNSKSTLLAATIRYYVLLIPVVANITASQTSQQHHQQHAASQTCNLDIRLKPTSCRY
jgi:hypothetical protein